MNEPVLNRTHLAAANKGLASLNRAIHVADQADAIGLDTTEHRQSIEFLREALMRLKQTFFPGQP